MVILLSALLGYSPELEERKKRGLSVYAYNIVQDVEVHGWLLSGIEELTIYFAALFFYSSRLSHRLNIERLCGQMILHKILKRQQQAFTVSRSSHNSRTVCKSTNHNPRERG